MITFNVVITIVSQYFTSGILHAQGLVYIIYAHTTNIFSDAPLVIVDC